MRSTDNVQATIRIVKLTFRISFVFFLAGLMLWIAGALAEVSGQTSPTFVFAPQASTGLGPYGIELADMDGDGDKDMVTSNLVDQEFSTVSVSKNNGNGTFAAPVDYPVGPNPKDLRVADFNGDGRPDVVCLAALSGKNPKEQSYATVLFNNGSGALVNRVDYLVGENANSNGIDVGDYTGDGITDFAVASLMTGIYVYRNTGNGSFVLWTAFAGFSESTHIASADFNGDGKLDLVAGNTDDGRIYLNNGTGFTNGVFLSNFGDGVAGIATGDFDNDGQPDVALSGQHLSVYRNLGGGTSFTKTAYLAGENGGGIRAADMDADGYIDITVSNYLGNSVSVYSNNGSGGFADKREWGVGAAPNSHAIADVNADGKLDIVAAASNLSQTSVNVVLNAGNRFYIARRDYGIPGSAWGVGFADFNGDGYRDVVTGGVVVGSDQYGPFVFYGKPDGTLQDGIQVDFWTNNSPTDVAVGDFNSDGWPDIVSSIFSPGNRIRVNINQGNGTFLPSVSYTAGGNPRGVDVGDLNGDGKLDIVNAQAALNDNSISIFIGNGDGTFQPQVKVDAGFRPIDVLLADFDQNGRSEVIVTHSGTNSIYYFKPNAAGVLGAPQIIDIGGSQGNAVAADFDNDGWLDAMVGAGNAVLLRNNQTGGFLPHITTPVPAGFIAAGDWDQDGLMDVVGTNGVLSLALVGWNHGGGNFTYVSSLQAGFETGRVGAADLNSDGLPEIVTANLRARSISVFTNTTMSAPTPTPTTTPTATPTIAPVISGTVTYGNAIGAPNPRFVSNALVSGAGSPNMSIMTDFPGGAYTLIGFGLGAYTITPSKTGGVNGISSFDAARIAQHAVGINPLTGTQLIVADVSGNSTISSFDAGQVARYTVSILGSGSTGNWIFSPLSRTYPAVTTNIIGEDYTGLLMGEVSGNWTNTGARPVGSRQLAFGGGPERDIAVELPTLVVSVDKEIIVPVKVQGVANKGIISYEFDLRYDPSVMQPLAEPVDVAGTASRGLSVVTNGGEPGLLRVVVYGAMPIDTDGVLLNLRFTAVGAVGSVSPLTWERIMFNEGEPVTAVNGLVERP